MDDYIKRKRKFNQIPEAKMQSQVEIGLRETRNQINQLISKVKHIQDRTSFLKSRLLEIEVKNGSLAIVTNQSILGHSQMQRSSIKTELPDGKAQKTNSNLQQTVKLVPTQNMVDQRNAEGPGRQSTNTTAQELQQSRKVVGRKRKTRI